MRKIELISKNRSSLAASLLVASGFAIACSAAGDNTPATQTVQARASLGTTPIPCDLMEPLQGCHSCHSAQPVSGVPMALVTWEDFQAASISDPGTPVYKQMVKRIHDNLNPMPPAKQGMLGPSSKAALDQWVANGTPKGNDPRCMPPLGAGGSPGGGGGGAGGRGVGGGTGSSGAPMGGASGTSMGGASGAPMGGASGTSTGGVAGAGGPPPDLGTCYQFLAHGLAQSGDKTPYTVTGEQYVAFDFDAPWGAGVQGITFNSVFDAHPEMIHHWLLYLASPNVWYPPQQPDGMIEPNENGSHPGATLVAGWAPGGNNGLSLPADVGMDISAKKLVLEIHFNGSGQSRSGLEVCVSKTPRPNTATVSWLGTESINLPAGQTASVSGTCAPSSTQDIHILRTWPHMHKIGVHMKTVVNHKAGTTETLVDKDFNFSSQVSYDNSILIKPGDTLQTTCTYNNNTNGNVVYGTKTTNEMCFNFVTAWPAGLLQHGSAMNSSLNPCMN